MFSAAALQGHKRLQKRAQCLLPKVNRRAWAIWGLELPARRAWRRAGGRPRSIDSMGGGGREGVASRWRIRWRRSGRAVGIPVDMDPWPESVWERGRGRCVSGRPSSRPWAEALSTVGPVSQPWLVGVCERVGMSMLCVSSERESSRRFASDISVCSTHECRQQRSSMSSTSGRRLSAPGNVAELCDPRRAQSAPATRPQRLAKSIF